MQEKFAVFIDLQGTLGGNGMDDISDFEFYPCAYKAIQLLNERGIPAIIITNQSRIAKGCISYKQYEERLDIWISQAAAKGAVIDAVYCCPHTKEDNCSCRKPLPGLILQALKDFELDISQSYIIGDMGKNDMVLANLVGAKGILVKTGVGEGSLTTFRHTWAEVEPFYVAQDVLEAVLYIIGGKHDANI